jgi:hypothetical protein
MEYDDDFQKLLINTMLYGTGVMTMTHNGEGDFTTRIVPIEEYTEVGEHLKWVDQNTKEAR